MSFLSVILILTFLSSAKSNNAHCNFSDCPSSEPPPSPPLIYSKKSLKCYACLNNIEGVKESCTHEGKFVTCKYSHKLINWEDVSYRKSMKFACLLLIYKESGDIKVKRGCVALPTEDYSVCTKFELNIMQCIVCETDKCNISNEGLRKRISKLSILLVLILIYCNCFNCFL